MGEGSNFFGENRCGPPNMMAMVSLDDLQSELRHALSERGILIYWSVHTNDFTFLIKEDQELKNIVRNLRSQDCYIQALYGETMTFEGKSLYPLLLQLKPQNDYECPAYFLLMEQGLNKHLRYVPYFFTSELSRDGALSYINRHLA